MALRGLRFVARAACAIPHPEKAARGGEDGFFMSRDGRVLGVADGVGGWAEQGVNPAFFTWKFLQRCLHYTSAKPFDSRIPLSQVLQNAWVDTVSSALQGSCTTAAVALDELGASAGDMKVLLVGDCGVLVVRDGKVALRTKERQYKFNFPHQIGSQGDSDPATLAADESFRVAADDVVILGTDGVFDNVFDSELVDLVAKASLESKGDIIDCQKLADAIANLAAEHGASHSFKSPFSVAALKAGYRYLGGKLDDVCVVVGVVGECDLDKNGAGGRAAPYDSVESYFKWAGKPYAAMPGRPSGKL